jgi:serine/threonine-protein kinase
MPFLCEQGALVAGRYRLVRLLGEGGMGAVWAASHTVTRKLVALKFLKVDPHKPEVRRRFLREARAASVLRHPNVVEVHDILELEDGAPVMVMDLLEGESLGERLKRSGRIPLDELARILVPVVSAVGTAHAAGIVHRDLKPDNIFLARGADGETDVRVLDFGVAKLTATHGDLAQSAGLTRTGDMVGTPYYMSPEQVFGEHDVDHRADVWSLGVILYECLTGERPFRADNVGQLLKRIMLGKPPDYEAALAGLPAEVIALIGRMLQHDRDQRPRDLIEVDAVLKRHTDTRAQSFSAARLPLSDQSREHMLVDAKAQTTDPFAKTTAASPASERARRIRMAAIGAGAALLLSAAGFVGWWRGHARAPVAAPVVAPTVAPPAPPAAEPPKPEPAKPAAAIDPAPPAPAPATKPEAKRAPKKGKPAPPAKPAPAPPAAAPAKKPLPGGVVDQVPF